MKYQYLLIVFLLSLCANANAEWFLRGTHNAWAAAQMQSAGAGTNTMQLKGVVFTAAGNIKFDRFGDWKESYGVGGSGGTNIAVAAGTWDIKFFTDTKKWSIAAPSVAATYHVRGTNNGWLEGTLMTRAGTTDTYELCVNFTAGDTNGGPRFKIDPNGGWGDGIPATDFLVTAGWVKISFNAVSKAITTQQNLAANCGAPTSIASISNSSSLQSSIVASSSSIKSSIASSSVKSSTISSSIVSSSSIKSSIASSSVASSSAASIYHVRGTFNGWLEGTLMNRVGTTDNYERCVNFVGGDTNGGPRFKIDPNGAWGDGIPAADFVVTAGWVKISFNSASKTITTQQNLAANCAIASSSSVINSSVKSSVASVSVASSAPASIYHVRGTFNGWLEGTLMNRIGTTDNYELCVNFVGTGTRFKVDPNGGWGDGIPAADFVVTPGWVKILFNSATKSISVQQNLTANCGVASSSSSISSVSSSASPEDFFFPAEPVYHLRGNFNGWAEGILMLQDRPHFPKYFYDLCVHFTDDNIAPVVRLDQNGGWGVDMVGIGDFVLPKGSGWTVFRYDRQLNRFEAGIQREQNCGNIGDVGGFVREVYPVDTVVVSQPPTLGVAFTPIHVRGTNNGWAEGTLMSQIGTTDAYEACINFQSGDANGGPRFRIDPNGDWGDAVPVNDLNVTTGWVKIGFNNTTKQITKRTNMRENCVPDIYGLIGTLKPEEVRSAWEPGNYFELVDGDSQIWKICRDFGSQGDNFGGPRFRIQVNHQGDGVNEANSSLPTFAASGWTAVTFTAPSSSTTNRDAFTQPENIKVTKNMAPNCAAP